MANCRALGAACNQAFGGLQESDASNITMVYSDVSPGDDANVVPGAPVHEDPSSLDRDGTRRARSEVNGIALESEPADEDGVVWIPWTPSTARTEVSVRAPCWASAVVMPVEVTSDDAGIPCLAALQLPAEGDAVVTFAVAPELAVVLERSGFSRLLVDWRLPPAPGAFPSRREDHAQHWQGNAKFDASVNGKLELELTLNNADTADAGIGTIDRVNNTPANSPIWWTRNADGDLEIYADAERTNLLGKLKNLPRGQAPWVSGNPSGSAELNDQTPPATGDYWRKS
jgi:hypothetical protein